MTKSYVRTATHSTLKVEANLTQILNFKANFHTEFEPFFKKKNYANNGGHFKIVSIKIKINYSNIKPYNLKKYKIVQTIRFSLAFFVIIFVRFQIPKYLKPDMEML